MSAGDSAESARIWLVGGKGMLASALGQELSARSVTWLATDRELDIGEPAAVLAFAREQRPTLIINAAAYTQVDDAESHEAVALRVNADGPGHLARAAREVGARLLHFSTDYVFDGRGQSPYLEQAATAPLTVYGRSKLAGEQRVRELLPDATYVLRTSWLFGHNGPSFVKSIVQLLRDREELRVVDDQRGRPTYTHDLARAALALAGVGGGKAADVGTYHFANTEEVTWYGFALEIREACNALGERLAVRRMLPVTTEEYPRPARRPAYSVLDTTKIELALGASPRSFRLALRDYLQREFRTSP